jgi:hypothetical protein
MFSSAYALSSMVTRQTQGNTAFGQFKLTPPLSLDEAKELAKVIVKDAMTRLKHIKNSGLSVEDLLEQFEYPLEKDKVTHLITPFNEMQERSLVLPSGVSWEADA